MVKIWIIFNGVITLIFICLYIIGYCVIQYIYLPTYNRMLLFIPVTFYGYGGIGIGLVSGRVTAKIAALIGSLGLDLLDIFQLMARAGLLGNAIQHFILLLERLQLFIKFIFRILKLFHSLRITS